MDREILGLGTYVVATSCYSLFFWRTRISSFPSSLGVYSPWTDYTPLHGAKREKLVRSLFAQVPVYDYYRQCLITRMSNSSKNVTCILLEGLQWYSV